MDIQRMEQVINEHGVPMTRDDVIRIVRDARGVDVTSIVTPPRPTGRSRRLGFPLPTPDTNMRMQQAYTEYRAARRMSAARFNGEMSAVASIYRNSSPMGQICRSASGSSNNIVYILQRSEQLPLSQSNEYKLPAPLIFDQNTRLDLEPELIGDIDHIRVQCFIPTNPTRTARNWSAAISLPRSHQNISPVTGYMPDTAPLIAAGWSIVTVPYGGQELPIGAYLPEAIDPTGRHLILLYLPSDGDYSTTTAVFCECMDYIKDRWTAAPVTAAGAPTEADRELATDLLTVLTFSESTNARVGQLGASIAEAREEARTFENTLAARLRQIDDECQELELLSNNMGARVIESARSMFTIHERVKEMNPVLDARILTEGNKIILEFETHQFGLTGSSSDIRLIPSIQYRVDMMADSYNRGIEIRKTHHTGGNWEENVLHPHANGGNRGNEYSTCWGEAGRRPLPDAWGRRDWITLVRILLAWHTRYNRHSPLTSWRTIRECLPRAPRSGWFLPEQLGELQQVMPPEPMVYEDEITEAIPYDDSNDDDDDEDVQLAPAQESDRPEPSFH